MKSYWGLIPRYLHKQKKQSLLIGVSIVLAVMLISVISNIGETIQGTLIEQVKNITGDYHASYNFVNQAQIDILKKDLRLDKVGTSLLLGDGILQDSSLKISVSGYDKQMIDMKRIESLDGSFPTNDGEIVIEEWLSKELEEQGQIGSVIAIDFQGGEDTYQGKIEFKISGIIKDNPSSKNLGLSTAYVTQNEVSRWIPDTENSYRAIVHVKEKRPLIPTIDDLKQKISIAEEQYSPNNSLLDELESDWSSNYIILILTACIVIAAIMMIYNVFYIMVTENIKEFGKLRTLGASSKQVKRIILGQGVVIGIISIPIGILLGIGVTECFGSIIKGIFDFNIEKMLISGIGIIFSCIIGLATTIVAALSPARMAGKVSPIEALNVNENGVKLKKTKHIIGTIFGKNGELAYRNLLRDKKKTIITILSITMGIILMILFSFYISSLKRNYILGGDSVGNYKLLSQGDADYDIGISDTMKKKLSNIDNVKKLYGVNYTKSDWTYFTDDTINENLKGAFSFYKDTSTNDYIVASNLYGYDEETMKLCENYLVDGTIDWESLRSGKGVLVAENMTGFGEKIKTLVQVGDEIVLKKLNRTGDEKQWEEPQTVKVMGVLSDLPIKQSETVYGLTLVAPQPVYSELTNYSTLQHIELDIDDDIDESSMKQSLESVVDNQAISVFSMKEVIKQREKEQKNVTLLGYALISVIIFIGYMNMRNTIKTSLLRRKKEFGMLRAIGISYGRITQIVCLEGIIYGVFSGVLGAVLGNIVSYVFFRIQEENMSLSWQVPWQMTVCTLIGAIIVGYISSRRAMRSIMGVSIIESIESI